VGFAPASNSSRRIGVWPRAAATASIVAVPHVSFGSKPSDSKRRTWMVSPCLTALYNGVCSIPNGFAVKYPDESIRIELAGGAVDRAA
jgi:hypothetical protein